MPCRTAQFLPLDCRVMSNMEAYKHTDQPVIFYLDDQRSNLDVFQAAMPDEWSVHIFDDPAQANDALKHQAPWVVVSDQRMPQLTGVDFLEKTKTICPNAQRIIVTGYSEEDLVIESVRRAEIFDYIRKPWDADDLVVSMNRAVERYRLTEELKLAQQATNDALIKQKASEAIAKAKTEFLANVSHELKTPLNAIIGYTEMILSDDKYDGIEAELDVIRKAGRHLDEIISNILIFNLMNDNDETVLVKRIDTNIHDLLCEVQSICHQKCVDNNNHISINVETTKPTIKVDAMQVKRILINLVENACKYTIDGAVTIQAQDGEVDGSIKFIVSDNGIGVSEGDQEKIFDMLTQLNMSATKSVGGLGIGLGISRMLANKIGGQLCVESQQGQGSTFILSL